MGEKKGAGLLFSIAIMIINTKKKTEPCKNIILTLKIKLWKYV